MGLLDLFHKNYLEAGNQAMQRHDYLAAAKYYTLAYDKLHEVVGAYNAYVALERTGALKTAFRYLENAAYDGYPAAIYELANCFFRGMGSVVERDYERARRFYEEAIDRGEIRGYANLGQIYELGLGVAVDSVKAFEYYTAGASHGCATCLNNLGVFHTRGVGGATQDMKKSFEYFRRSAEMGFGGGMKNLGTAYFYGYGCEKDPKLAYEYLSRASQMGVSEADEYLTKDRKALRSELLVEVKRGARQLGRQAVTDIVNNLAGAAAEGIGDSICK